MTVVAVTAPEGARDARESRTHDPGRVLECRPPPSLRVRTRETDESARRGDGLPFDTTIDVALAPDGAHTRRSELIGHYRRLASGLVTA